NIGSPSIDISIPSKGLSRKRIRFAFMGCHSRLAIGWSTGKVPVMSNEALYLLPRGVQTRWASPENPSGAKGKGGATNGGRKGSSNFPLKPGERRILA